MMAGADLLFTSASSPNVITDVFRIALGEAIKEETLFIVFSVILQDFEFDARYTENQHCLYS